MNINELDHMTGIDINLETSLFEYGIAWDSTAYKEDNKHEIDFLHGHDYNGEEYTLFYWSSMDLDDFAGFFDKTSWCDVTEIAKTSGLTIKQLYQGFPYTIHDFIMYYGVDNIFGSPPYRADAYFPIQSD